MTYKVLLVDDERPSLNYVSAIFKNYISGFEVCATAENATEALEKLEHEQIDLMICDISFPGEMNGIDLAKHVRQLYPEISIVILSAYAQFEYARGALQAGVDEYLLKPISPARAQEVAQAIHRKLDEQRIQQRRQTFISLASRRTVKPDAIEKCFGRDMYLMALVRFGNLAESRFAKSVISLPCPYQLQNLYTFYGRDESQLVLLLPEKNAMPSVKTQLETLLSPLADGRHTTIVYNRRARPVKDVPAFMRQASRLLDATLTIGCDLTVTVDYHDSRPAPVLSASTRRQLVSLLAGESWTAIQQVFLSLAVEWQSQALPQAQVEELCSQLISLIIGQNNPAVKKSIRQVYEQASTLYSLSAGMGELLTGLYATLFSDLSSHDKKISGEQLCEYTLRYIRQNYAHPLNIQSVCSKIGFSQTYLSRLLRKHANTTVNTYLTQCRIEAAKHMLEKNPDTLLKTVAISVGYDDQSYFNKIFRSETGLTPKQYAAQFIPSARVAQGE